MEILLRAASFNMKRTLIPFGKNAWRHRAEGAAELIRAICPDILGTQELTALMLGDISRKLSEYGWCGVARGGGAQGEYAAVFYRKDVFHLCRSRTFWLSKAPDKPASRAWFSLFPRICTEACLVHRESGQKILVFNTHLDHLSPQSRREGLALIVRTMLQRRAVFPHPVILLGDFNAKPESRTLKLFENMAELSDEGLSLVSSYHMLLKAGSPVGRSYHGFYGGDAGMPIDYIFTSREFAIRDVSVNRSRMGRLFPSDHYPIVADLILSVP